MLVNQMRAGALDLIVVYRSNVLSNPENAEKYMEIVEMNLPEAMAIQPYAVAKDSQHKYLMRRLLEAILAPDSQEHFIKAGFQWIAEGKRNERRRMTPGEGCHRLPRSAGSLGRACRRRAFSCRPEHAVGLLRRA